MTINVIKLSTQSMTIVVPTEHQEEFKKMINRAFNCWPDASPAMKEFADRVTNDKPMQDYYGQSGKQRPEEPDNH